MQMEDQGLIAGTSFPFWGLGGPGGRGATGDHHHSTARQGVLRGQPTSCSLPTLHVLPLTAPHRSHRSPGDAVHRVAGPPGTEQRRVRGKQTWGTASTHFQKEVVPEPSLGA